MISCLVAKDGDALFPQPHLENSCLKYKFSLEKRGIVLEHYGKPFPAANYHHQAARNYFDELVGTPEKLMTFIKNNFLPKDELAKLFSSEAREFYLERCACFERF